MTVTDGKFSEVEVLNILKLPRDTQGLGRLVIDLQVCKRKSGSDPRTGTFYQVRPMVGHTPCSVKVVLGCISKSSDITFKVRSSILS